jgi:hypothetical protein
LIAGTDIVVARRERQMRTVHLSLVVGLAAMALGASPAHAGRAFDACVRKLCVSTGQMDCWVKSGSEICTDDGACHDLPDHAGARILDKSANSWNVETQYGSGWVANRSMMVDSSFCPDL